MKNKVIILIKRDILVLLRTHSTILFCAMPLLIACFYRLAFAENPSMLASTFSLFSNLNILFISINVLPYLIVVDRERHIDRTLLLSGVKRFEMLLSKNIVVMLVVITNQVIIALLFNIGINIFVKLILASVGLGIIMQLFATVLSIFFRTDLESGLSTTISFMILLLAPEFALHNKAFSAISYMLPSLYSKDYFESIILVSNRYRLLHSIGIGLLWITVNTIIIYLNRNSDKFILKNKCN